ncbi:MAG TPA: aldehyde dehydrogenase family protein, partial [Chitinophagaceae bacterium]|nr:aldehyde dehydrogenase family protein [Chitinophagaceae bacterium]
MNLGYFSYPLPINEPVLNYGPGSAERTELKNTIEELKNQSVDVPLYIGGKEVRTGKLHAIRPPHEISRVLGHFHEGDRSHVEEAISAALSAASAWADMNWENRAAIFLRAADLIATKYRYHMLGTTMLGQGKNVYQA